MRAPGCLRPRVSTRGQSMVEFSLVLPLLTVLFFSLIDLSFVFFQSTILSHATRTTTREASIKNYSSAQIRQRIKERSWGFTLSDEDIVVSVIDHQGVPAEAAFGNFVDVRVTYTLAFLTPVSFLVKGTALEQLRCAAKFQIE